MKNNASSHCFLLIFARRLVKYFLTLTSFHFDAGRKTTITAVGTIWRQIFRVS
jgi:hypothetical protein